MSIVNEFLDTPEKSEEEIEETTEEVTTDDLESLSKEDLAAALIKLDASNKQLHARAVKAEAKAKERAEIIKPKQETINLTDEVDMRFLKRDGLSDEDIEQLKFIQAGQKAMGKDISLMEAQTHPLFQSFQSERQLKEKRERAQLISNGSSGGGQAKMSEEDWESKRKETADAILAKM